MSYIDEAEIENQQQEVLRRLLIKKKTQESTPDNIEIHNIRKKLYAQPAPPIMWHETDWNSALSILQNGFVLGIESKKGELSHLVYGHPSDALLKRNRAAYVRDTKPAYLKIDVSDLRLFNYFWIPYVPGDWQTKQPRGQMYFELNQTGKLPVGYDGFFNPGVEIAIRPVAATERLSRGIYSITGKLLKSV